MPMDFVSGYIQPGYLTDLKEKFKIANTVQSQYMYT